MTFKRLNTFKVFTAVQKSLPGYGVAGEAARGMMTGGASNMQIVHEPATRASPNYRFATREMLLTVF